MTHRRTREVGNLVSALEPALRDERGIWLGWSGQERSHDARVVVDPDAQPARARFDLPPTVRQQFYAGFCNSVLWPMFHGFAQRVRCNDGDWDAYVQANERYARHAIELAQRDATIWVHDYHLLLVARSLRALGHCGRIGLFLHIPFPAGDLLGTIPWGRELVEAMLDFDLLGFQTTQAATNFISAAPAVKAARCEATVIRRRDHVTEIGVPRDDRSPAIPRAHRGGSRGSGAKDCARRPAS